MDDQVPVERPKRRDDPGHRPGRPPFRHQVADERLDVGAIEPFDSGPQPDRIGPEHLQIARVGFDGVRRKTALGLEVSEKPIDLRVHVPSLARPCN